MNDRKIRIKKLFNKSKFCGLDKVIIDIRHGQHVCASEKPGFE
jgi:hypothetical protein